MPAPHDQVDLWLSALEARHLANLRHAEIARAIRALSSCYVERRGKLASGGALATAGKRAAFALFFGPLHFIVVREVVKAVDPALGAVREVVDLGCGTGVAGAAWALETGARVSGIDRHVWAIDEANRTYRDLGLDGRARRGDAARVRLQVHPRSGIVAAYAVNELAPDTRTALLDALVHASARGARILIVEPIARRLVPWWPEWQQTIEACGGRSDEWRFRVPLPARQALLARAAGLDVRELTARTLILGFR